MKTILKMEELAQLITAIIIIYNLPVELHLWVWLLLFFLPDVSLAGYLLSPKTGGILYNVFHHKGVAALVIATGLLLDDPGFQAAGVLLWAHASFDRIMGYGLKYLNSFQHTHLGRIGSTSSTKITGRQHFI